MSFDGISDGMSLLPWQIDIHNGYRYREKEREREIKEKRERETASLTHDNLLTVSSPDLEKGHQPLERFCWKMETISVLSLSISSLQALAVLAPRG